MNTTPLMAFVATTLLSVSCSFQHRARTDKIIEVDHIPGAAVSVTSRNGAIELRAGAKEPKVKIHVRLTATGATMHEAEERLAAVVVECSRAQDNTLVVEARFPDKQRGGDGAGYVIDVPDAKGAVLQTSNGSITVEGVAGLLDLDTSNGKIRVSGPTAGIEARSSNGSIRVTEAEGPVDVKTSNGSIRVSLKSDQPGPVLASTSNGSIGIVVGSAFKGRMGLATSNGRVHVHNQSDAPLQSTTSRNKGSIVFTKDQQDSRVSSSNGSITVTVKN